jgi:hypothetical protein
LQAVVSVRHDAAFRNTLFLTPAILV